MDTQLGFCNLPEPVYIYVGYQMHDEKASCWYRYNVEANLALPIFKPALAGYLRSIRVTVKEFKGKENPKLELVISADETYIIRSGLETVFAKCALLGLSQISDFEKPLIIGVQPGSEKVVFCRIYDQETKQRIYMEWNPDCDCCELISKIQSVLKKVSLTNIPQLMEESTRLIDLLGWKVEDGRDYLIKNYNVKGRSLLTPEQLQDFVGRLAMIAGNSHFRASGGS